MSKDRRYIVTLDLYIWAESDQEAINNSEALAKHQMETTDNQCKVVSVHDASTHKPRKIK